MLDQREAPIVGVEDQPSGLKKPSHIAAFNVGGLNLSPASNDEDFDINIDASQNNTAKVDLFADGGMGKKTADQRATEFTNEMGMAPDVKVGNGSGSLGQLSAREVEERKRERSEEAFEALLEQIEELQKQDERARKWDAEMHDFGGKKFSGQQLMEMRSWLMNEDNQEEFENDLMKRQGITKEEAKKRRLETQEALDLKKRERDGTMTPEERRRYEQLMAKPEMRENIEVLEERAAAGKQKDFSTDVKAAARAAGDREVSKDERVSFFSKDDNSPAASGTVIDGIDTPLIQAKVDIKGDYNKAAPNRVAEPEVMAPAPASAPAVTVAAVTPPPQGSAQQKLTASVTF